MLFQHSKHFQKGFLYLFFQSWCLQFLWWAIFSVYIYEMVSQHQIRMFLFIFLNNAATVAVNTTVPVIMNISNNDNKNLGRFIHIHLYTLVLCYTHIHTYTHMYICCNLLMLCSTIYIQTESNTDEMVRKNVHHINCLQLEYFWDHKKFVRKYIQNKGIQPTGHHLYAALWQWVWRIEGTGCKGI